MIINNNLLKFIFNKKQFLKFIFYIVILISTTILCLSIATTYVVNAVVQNYQDIIDNTPLPLKKKYNDTLFIKCIVVNCDIIIKDKEAIYEIDHVEGKIIKTTKNEIEFIKEHPRVFNLNLTRDFYILVPYEDSGSKYTFVIDRKILGKSLVQAYEVIIGWFLLGYIILYLRSMYITYRNKIFEKGSYKMYAESRLQTNISDVLNHELNTPLAIIKSIKSEIKEIFSKSHLVDKSEEDEIFSSFDYAISRLDAIVNMLTINKKIKRKNIDVSIIDLLEHSIRTINRIHITTMEVEYHNQDILSITKLSEEIDTGDFLNIIHVLLNNAVEACSDKITFKGDLIGTKLALYITDNGNGIRDINNKIIKTNTIFTWGYSSKTIDGKPVYNDKWYVKLLGFFNVQIINENPQRGMGLFVNKMLLQKSGGDIELVDTSENGTTFVVYVPIIAK